MLKVALFMHDFAGGGVERMRLSLAAALMERGCMMTIVVVNAKGPLAAAVPAGVGLVDLKSNRLLQATPKLRRYLQERKPDILISSLDHNNVAALCACATTRTGTRLIICQHNSLAQEAQLGWKYRIVPLLYRLLAFKADAIVAVSRGVGEELAAMTGLKAERITVIGNPVIQSAQFHPLPPPDHPWMQDGTLPVFVFAGRLTAQKNPMMLISAFARHIAAHPARLVVLGEGPMLDAMQLAARRAQCDQHVCFAGYVSEPMRWIAHAQALLLTSRYEGFANVIVEALACGTPVIATDCPHGPAEILDHGKYGRLVRIGDDTAFADAMADDLRARFPAAHLRERARNFTAEQAAANHLALFRQWFPSANARSHDQDNGGPGQAKPGARTRNAFGLRFTAESAEQIAANIVADRPARTKLLVTPNIDHVRLLGSRPAFRAACASADTVCADGWPVALYAAIRGAAPRQRATGCDILHALLCHSQIGRTRVAAIVENEGTAAILARWLADRNLDTWCVEVAPAGLAEDPSAQVRLAAKIFSAQPHILIMTLGAPTSETFIHQNAGKLPQCWAICVGQALRVEIGLTCRAPPHWRRAGLEWAWRCVNEPLRLGPRYLRALLWFPYAVAADLLAAFTAIAKQARQAAPMS